MKGRIIFAVPPNLRTSKNVLRLRKITVTNRFLLLSYSQKMLQEVIHHPICTDFHLPSALLNRDSLTTESYHHFNHLVIQIFYHIFDSLSNQLLHIITIRQMLSFYRLIVCYNMR